MGLESEVLECTGGFESERTAADDGDPTGGAGAGDDGFEIFDGAIDEDVGKSRALKVGDERARAGGKDEFVVGVFDAGAQADGAAGAVNGDDRVAGDKRDALVGISAAVGEGERVGTAVSEVIGQMNTVVGGAGFLA